MKEKSRYNLINLIVLLTSAYIFIQEYKYIENIFVNLDFIYFVILTTSVIFIHAIKSIRLYFLLYGCNISLYEHLKIYCKVAPITAILPYKLGEFFRIYCYGRQIKSIYRGIIIILLDRFMDTLALVTMMFIVSIFNGNNVPLLTYILIIFLITMFAIYFIFPGIYNFWKKFLMSSKATENKISLLKTIYEFKRIYNEISKLMSGRGFILYVLSLIAWGIELASLALVKFSLQENSLAYDFSLYLSSALGVNDSIELRRFVIVSILVLIVAYIALKIRDIIAKRRKYL